MQAQGFKYNGKPIVFLTIHFFILVPLGRCWSVHGALLGSFWGPWVDPKSSMGRIVVHLGGALGIWLPLPAPTFCSFRRLPTVFEPRHDFGTILDICCSILGSVGTTLDTFWSFLDYLGAIWGLLLATFGKHCVICSDLNQLDHLGAITPTSDQ